MIKFLERQFTAWECLGVGDNSQQEISVACKSIFSSTVLFKLILWHGCSCDTLHLSFVRGIAVAKKDIDER